jgi:hypothetical protein
MATTTEREPDPAKGEFADIKGTIRVCLACKPGSRARQHICGLSELQRMLRIGGTR